MEPGDSRPHIIQRTKLNLMMVKRGVGGRKDIDDAVFFVRVDTKEEFLNYDIEYSGFINHYIKTGKPPFMTQETEIKRLYTTKASRVEIR